MKNLTTISLVPFLLFQLPITPGPAKIKTYRTVHTRVQLSSTFQTKRGKTNGFVALAHMSAANPLDSNQNKATSG